MFQVIAVIFTLSGSAFAQRLSEQYAAGTGLSPTPGGSGAALKRIAADELPQLQIDDADQGSFEAGSRSELKKALIRQRAQCRNPGVLWNFAGKIVSQERWCIETANWFLSKIEEVKSLNELYTLARNELEWYQSTGKPDTHEVQFTGYYNPVYRARKLPDSIFRYPLYSTPRDLSKPYLTREQIVNGALRGRGLELAYLDNPVDPYILQVQGSGTLMIEEKGGRAVRQIINYAAENGQPYVSLGKVMRAAGIPEEYISLQGIRKYFLDVHPLDWEKFSNQNPSYVFFKKDNEGPYGSSGAILTPKHSIAVDEKVFPMGAIGLIKTERPSAIVGDQASEWKSFSQFVVAQDTGGAIQSPGRVDVFWGEGAYAEVTAGRTDRLGSLYFALVPERKRVVVK